MFYYLITLYVTVLQNMTKFFIFQNVTLLVNVSSARAILADMKMELEYSHDVNRKLELSCVVEDNSKRTNRNYALHLLGKHPETK